MRIGIMGCGVVADYGHIPAILATPGLELAAVYDPAAERAEACAAKFGVSQAFSDQQEFLECGLQAVVVCSSAPAHPENVFAAARHGLHVLCEKPLALHDSDAEAMIAAMKAAEKMLLVGFVYRFSQVAVQFKKWIDDRIVGDPKTLRLVYLWDLHGQYESSDGKGWIESPRWQGRMLEGGPMIDCGVHMIDLARWWLGSEVVAWQASGSWVSDYVAPDHVFLHMDHAGGEHSFVEMSFTYGHTAKYPDPVFSYDLIGTGGVARYHRDGWLLEARDGQNVIRVPGASEKNFAGMYAHFERALRTGDPGDFPNGTDGLIATQIARQATEFAIARRPDPFVSSRAPSLPPLPPLLEEAPPV